MATRRTRSESAFPPRSRPRTPPTREEFANAAEECKAERAEDPEAFTEKYGKGKKKKRNALGKCVSATVKVAAEPLAGL